VGSYHTSLFLASAPHCMLLRSTGFANSYHMLEPCRRVRLTVSEAVKLGVNVFPAIVYAVFETAIHKPVTTVWPYCEGKALRFHLG